jgi:hypothetical protein
LISLNLKLDFKIKGDVGEIVNINIDMRLYKGDVGERGPQGPRVNNKKYIGFEILYNKL